MASEDAFASTRRMNHYLRDGSRLRGLTRWLVATIQVSTIQVYRSLTR